MTKRALKSDWDRCEPLPKQHKEIPCSYKFTAEEHEKLKLGLVPEQMEDKWFIYFENDKLYLHRSWTGFCVYIVEFGTNEKCHQINKITVNRYKEQYSETNDIWDCKLVIYLINVLLLKKPVPFPEYENTDPEMNALRQWSETGRAMFDVDE